MFAPYLPYLRVASYVLVFAAGWMVNGWRHDAASAEADRQAADRRIEVTDQVRVQEREDAKTADKVDQSHAAAKDKIAAEEQQNHDLTGGITAAADRVRGTRDEAGGNIMSRGTGTAGSATVRSADAYRADRCEALLAEGIGLVAEGGELLRGTAYNHDGAAAYAAAGHEWAMRRLTK